MRKLFVPRKASAQKRKPCNVSNSKVTDERQLYETVRLIYRKIRLFTGSEHITPESLEVTASELLTSLYEPLQAFLTMFF